ncbi:Inactive metal-dependent protease-like protein [Liberibacter crescens BT-1]|uniref:Inactive metal-dependent protease-like protein n=1 Tax=Liberibacter crescens (strain BT-1) TaxID=1215343 RepID=L0EU20_LIBCB|nr:tRNA (adenosine(37)-N6)-threonylcarbamoyltransferase complex dimerization subunit type 1 TsaB [Liberibacter crescens]AGA64148.1 Inactive metal-dependent protease-like protein [Liberibacter crescens BT-1]AMC12416.1 hypothetical protein RL73_00950 [Liberibacter crescens]
MIILALDTSSVECSVAVYDSLSTGVLGFDVKVLGRGHAEYLIESVDAAIIKSGLSISQVECIVTTVGPGSFTGVRVAVSAARGFALALGCPALGIGNLEVLAHAYLERSSKNSVMALINGRIGYVYLQSFSIDGSPLSEAMLVSYEKACVFIENFNGVTVGYGVDAFKELDMKIDRYPIDVIARLGALRLPQSPRPIYFFLP